MANIQAFTKAIINFYGVKGDYISNKKLQKLLYYIQAWHFVYFEDNNLFDEDVLPQAWVHGPVFPSIYDTYKEFTYKPIMPEDVIEETLNDSLLKLNLNVDQIDLVQQVINKYGSKSAFELEFLSHSEAPWIEARKNIKPNMPSSNTISKQSIIDYYSSLLS